jgi:hypothetical protein
MGLLAKYRNRVKLENSGELLKLQPKQQEVFNSKVDIAISGGAAGGGKSALAAAIAADQSKIINEKYRCVIFRRTHAQARNPGGMVDETKRWYPTLNGRLNESRLEWVFPSGAKVTLSHLQHEKDRLNWQGTALCTIIWDELTHFTETQFWYLMSRARSISGIRPIIRATCNPDADSWVANLINWWIGDDGYPNPDRAGVSRWFVRKGLDTIWRDTREELLEIFPSSDPKSLAFYPSKLEDNQALMTADPNYKGMLESLSDPVEVARLLDGNWKIRSSESRLFKQSAIFACAVGNWQDPKLNHNYLIGVDPNFGGSDFFVFQVWDLTRTPYQLVYEFREQKQSILSSIAALGNTIDRYQPFIVSVEKNGGGQTILETIAAQYPGTRMEAVNTSHISKKINTDRIAIAVESLIVVYPADWVGINEMLDFSKIAREAVTGNDDCIMAWAVAFAFLDEALENGIISPTLLF